MVTLVTELVKFDKLPTTDDPKFWTPLAMDAAKSAPGKWGSAAPGMAPPGVPKLAGVTWPALGMPVAMGGL